jgi:hypothetical protein
MRFFLIISVLIFSLNAGCQSFGNLKICIGPTLYIGNNALSKASATATNLSINIRLLGAKKFTFYLTPELQIIPINDKSYFGNTKKSNAFSFNFDFAYFAFGYNKFSIEPYLGLGFQNLKHQINERAFQFSIGSFQKYKLNNNLAGIIKVYYQKNNYNYPAIRNADNKLFNSSQSINLGFGIVF